MTFRFRALRPAHTLAVAATLITSSAQLAAQAPARPFTLAGFGGGISSLGGGGGEFRLTHEDGVRLGYDVSPVITLRAVVTSATRETSGSAWGKRAGTDISHRRYAAEVVAGPAGARNVRPYVFGGAGVVRNDPRGDGDANTSGALRAGVGFEWRPGRSHIGAAFEAGANAYRLNTLGVRQTQYDFAWNGGLSLHW
jgi:Outer membrane protein beta-barrel domain